MSFQSEGRSASLVKRALLAVEELQARLRALEQKGREPLAIVGAACRFPGHADTPADFWRLLCRGVDAVGPIPDERWDTRAYYDARPETPGKTYAPHGAFIDRIDQFDAAFFGIAPVEAASMDPQQRLLLEVSWHAFENAGIAPSTLRGSRTGVFVGICASDYLMHTLGSRIAARIDAFAGTGAAASVAAGRLSYFFGLHGPSLPIDTACSSSLVALHLACQSLRREECDLALVAGVSAILSPEVHVYFSKTRALSPHGRCRAFDAEADGYVRGEGCGVLVLKRLSSAVAAGDSIVAVVRGTAVNHDGRSAGLTAPNGPAQQDVIKAALADAGLSAADVDYVETHGTGTPLGDPIEVVALGAAYGAHRPPDRPLWLGSVKSNIGHLEGAAGIAAAMKTALMLQHGEMPPHLHFRRPSPHIPWEQLPVRIVEERRQWQTDSPRVAGVSSFGFSGTNVHALLAQAPPVAIDIEGRRRTAPYVLPLAAASASGLKALAGAYADCLGSSPDLDWGDVCHSAAVGRSHLAWRLAVVADDMKIAARALAAVSRGERSGEIVLSVEPVRTPPRVVLQFAGQGAQYAGMGARLVREEPVFHDALARCDALLRPHLPKPLMSVMYPDAGEDASLIHETLFSQPALFAFEYALTKLWQSWGLEPAAVIGHSVGELVAACVADVISLEDATRLVAARARLMQGLPPTGAMAAVFAPETEVSRVIRDVPAVATAAINGPEHVVISGDRSALEACVRKFEEAGRVTRPLQVSHAFHSQLMDPILSEFESIAAAVRFASPRLPIVSNVTGAMFEEGLAPDASYWTRHLREPVRYHDGLQALVERDYQVFLEIGPKPILTELGRRSFADRATWIASCDDRQPSAPAMALARAYAGGCAIAWEAVYPSRQYRRVLLPNYPFERKRHWVDRPGLPPAPAAAARPADSGQAWQHRFVDVLASPGD